MKRLALKALRDYKVIKRHIKSSATVPQRFYSIKMSAKEVAAELYDKSPQELQHIFQYAAKEVGALNRLQAKIGEAMKQEKEAENLWPAYTGGRETFLSLFHAYQAVEVWLAAAKNIVRVAQKFLRRPAMQQVMQQRKKPAAQYREQRRKERSASGQPQRKPGLFGGFFGR